MDCGLALRLLPVVLGAPGVSPSATDAQHAALLEVRGELGAARVEADAILSKRPDHPGALFVAACAALEAGDLDAAAYHTKRLQARSPVPPQAVILGVLVERRRVQPFEKLRDALVQSWKLADRPNLEANPLLPDLESWGRILPPIPRQIRDSLMPGERLLFDHGGSGDSPEYVALALEAGSYPRRTPSS